ncbi:MAG: GTP 3',8-cyclase MoaA [Methanosarcinales archaeon]|nr:MAG: GTP 3',8-cyclase MoaA [Methanosarcinales archaeon]
MHDKFGREINSLRISVTQRCNLCCFYCHREGQNSFEGEMSPAEIEKIVEIGGKLGIKKLKLTGGEPLMREDICEIVQCTSDYMKETSMTTNGVLLDRYAGDLRDAGLRRVNISLDVLDAERYKTITGRDCSQQVIRGVEAAIANDLTPVKLNVVVMKGVNDHEIEEMIHFAGESGTILQLIELETDGDCKTRALYEKYHCDFAPIEGRLERDAIKVVERELHRRRKYFIENGSGVTEVEVVRPMHNTTFCENCTRIRVTSDGKLKPCLLRNDNHVDIIGSIRGGASDEELTEIFKKAILLREPFWR